MASRPSPPTGLSASQLSATYLVLVFDDGWTNGAPIDARQIGWGPSPTTIYHIVDSDGSTLFQNLSQGTTYYFWARTHNSEGWSDWSARRALTTYDVPDAPTQVVVSNIAQNSLSTKFVGNYNGGTRTFQYELGYGTNSGTPQTIIVDNDGMSNLTNLVAGATYYFWARGLNDVGYSAWSKKTTAVLKAGAWVDVNGVKKRAVPYVKVNGVWKVAQPYVKTYGLWKPTE